MLVNGEERVLVIAPHADDEVLGCGGLIDKARHYDNDVKVIIGSVGDISFQHKNERIIESQTRKQELREALVYLGCEDHQILFENKESAMDTIPMNQIVAKLDRILHGFDPTMIFIPYPSYHQDHQVLFQASMASLRPVPNRNPKLVAMYEYPLIVWQYPKVNDVGELYLDITDSIDRKVDAFCKHQSQIRTSEHLISPENIKKWAAKRGMETGVGYAEKYHLIRGQLL
ncbi:PIG-L deacetylase family protein [Pseudalkalibacillus salsuginis]|uniref:PIG-L deacetylase family protein n=1 Tax=Pseudalkalibacillus salsuginis TaxID=2910972 RepID=UPI001F1ED450|nr:PIG-L deacetylase family protein [Pseudalkalibacillus salsuginis]MCF6409174.1 PIG-L family deacetylase [Pseudalkalibacillus salsuginis]